MRRVSERVLGRPRPQVRISDGVRASADAGGVSLRPHSGSYGGSGLPLSAACAILEDDPRNRLQCRRVPRPDVHDGHRAEARQRGAERAYLPGIATGALRLQAFGVTEPATGSDTTQLKTRAEKKGNDRYVVNGQKVWTSRALHSDLMLLLARTTPADKVRRRSEGLSYSSSICARRRTSPCTSGRSTRCSITRPPRCSSITWKYRPRTWWARKARAFKYIVDSMNAERILIASECLGDGRYFIRRATDYAKERVVFGWPIGQNQGIQFPIARAHAELAAAELMVHKAAALFEAGQDCGAEANMGKMLAARRLVARGGGVSEDVRRLWLRTRIRHRAEMARDAALSDCADLDEHDPRLRCPARARSAAELLKRAGSRDASDRLGDHRRDADRTRAFLVRTKSLRNQTHVLRVTEGPERAACVA